MIAAPTSNLSALLRPRRQHRTHPAQLVPLGLLVTIRDENGEGLAAEATDTAEGAGGRALFGRGWWPSSRRLLAVPTHGCSELKDSPLLHQTLTERHRWGLAGLSNPLVRVDG